MHRERGASFGEVALLANVPRTATITATRPGSLLAVQRVPFLVAMTGSDSSRSRMGSHSKMGLDIECDEADTAYARDVTAAQPNVQIDNEHVRVDRVALHSRSRNGRTPSRDGLRRRCRSSTERCASTAPTASTGEHQLRAGSSQRRPAPRHNVINASDFDFAFVEIELKPTGAALSRAQRGSRSPAHGIRERSAVRCHDRVVRPSPLRLVANGLVYDGEEEVRQYFTASRSVVPDQRNELIALHCAGDAVIAEFWLLGTVAGRLTDQRSVLGCAQCSNSKGR